jgi:hypothetical protein
MTPPLGDEDETASRACAPTATASRRRALRRRCRSWLVRFQQCSSAPGNPSVILVIILITILIILITIAVVISLLSQ